jgi:hypothetical protein
MNITPEKLNPLANFLLGQLSNLGNTTRSIATVRTSHDFNEYTQVHHILHATRPETFTSCSNATSGSEPFH